MRSDKIGIERPKEIYLYVHNSETNGRTQVRFSPKNKNILNIDSKVCIP